MAEVDRMMLHRYLYAKTNSRGTVRVSQKNLAEGLGVTKFTMSKIMKDMETAGRLKKLGWGGPDGVDYLIRDPAPFEE